MAEKFNIGDEIKLKKGGIYGTLETAHTAKPFGEETIYRVMDITSGEFAREQRIKVAPIASPGNVYGDFSSERFTAIARVGKETKVENMKAMSLAVAREQAARIVAAGVAKENVRIRTRSWDNDGSFFAVDVQVPNPTGGTNQKQSMYLPANVDAFLATIKPIELTPYQESKRLGVRVFQFRAGGDFLRAPDGSYWFSEADIKKLGGKCVFRGKHYVLGEQKFVAFVG